MKDTWEDLFESKSFLLSVLASLFTVLLISFYEIIDTAIPDDNKMYFKVSFTLVLILLIGRFFKQLNKSKDIEFEIEKAKKK